jgi:hypothetical protein
MIGRDFYKQLRLLNGRSETIRTRFELNQDGQLVEHVTLETHDKPAVAPMSAKKKPPQELPRGPQSA